MPAPPRSRLRDVIAPRPRILFVGINPSLRSGEVGHHFAGPGNPFWRLLHASGLVPVPLAAEDDQRLADFGVALINLCPRPTRSAAELTPAELAAGKRRLPARARAMQPAVVALVGVTLYTLMFGATATPGPGPKPETLAGARVFVLPNPSGRNAAFPGFADKQVWFERLRAFTAAT
ncbi:MAG TPA: mismatch-specific DNA-glycosylase [Kofleriaceae bacterium]|nr:mismatch-specific DNA-glycosylase [Kofleriaceae bacterium]